MKFGYYLSVFFLVLITVAYAQPGGGGGLNISYITHPYTGDTLEINDQQLKINHYVMNEKFTKSVYQFQTSQINQSYYTGEYKFIYLPPTYYDSNYQLCKNQRLEIIYDVDTMIVDFIGVMQENAAGYTEQMNRIQFFPGAYKMHLTESARFDSCYKLMEQFPDQIQKLQKDMRAGISISGNGSSLRDWHILEEAFNPNVHLIWARYQRENCEEKVLGTVENQATRLCEKMMELDETTLHLSTVQKPHMVDDTLTLQYYFYFSFNNRQITPPVDSSNTENVLRYPTEERQLAENYLDAFEKKTLFVNGVKFTGTVVLYINKAKQDLFENSYQEEKHYYFKQGKLLYTYIPFYPPNPEPAEER